MERLTEKLKSGGYVPKAPLYTMCDKLGEYEDLEEQWKLLKLPCAVGDFALFFGGTIIPVIYITLSANGHITVGCQNGIRVPVDSMWGNSGSSCKGFFRTKEEAEAALKELEDAKRL